MHSRHKTNMQVWSNRIIALLYVLLAAASLFLPLPILFRMACLSLLSFLLFILLVRQNSNRWIVAARLVWALLTTLLFVFWGLWATGRI